ncbi:MAG: DUF5667 domain-containing protein [Bacillaceae bacterium]|nr:DUF5667 domain-containing protein [Bacillaceae bacterium]
MGSVVHAEENPATKSEIAIHHETAVITPDFEVYETIRMIEEVEYELTEDVTEKISLQDEYADKRLAEIEEMVEAGLEDEIEELLKDYEKHMEEVEKVLEEAKEEETDLTDVEEVISEKNEKRFENLLLLLEREDLPEQAKAGISRAIANKHRAMERSGQLERHGMKTEVETDLIEIDQEEELVVVEEVIVAGEIELQTNNSDQQEEPHDKAIKKS